jgi:hypothetical protein
MAPNSAMAARIADVGSGTESPLKLGPKYPSSNPVPWSNVGAVNKPSPLGVSANRVLPNVIDESTVAVVNRITGSEPKKAPAKNDVFAGKTTGVIGTNRKPESSVAAVPAGTVAEASKDEPSIDQIPTSWDSASPSSESSQKPSEKISTGSAFVLNSKPKVRFEKLVVAVPPANVIKGDAITRVDIVAKRHTSARRHTAVRPVAWNPDFRFLIRTDLR